jgi:hypothetical protein
MCVIVAMISNRMYRGKYREIESRMHRDSRVSKRKKRFDEN